MTDTTTAHTKDAMVLAPEGMAWGEIPGQWAPENEMMPDAYLARGDRQPGPLTCASPLTSL